MHLKVFFALLGLTLCPAMALAQNVGIGTTTPQAKLHLKQDGEALRLEGDENRLSFYDNLGQYQAHLWNRLNGPLELGSTTAAGKAISIAAGGNPVAIFTRLGRVGIGTTSPFTTLDVNGSIRLRYPGTLEFGNTLNDGGLSFQAGLSGNNEFAIYSTQSASLSLRLSGQGALTLTGPVTATAYQYQQPQFRWYSLGEYDMRTPDGRAAIINSTDNFWAPNFAQSPSRFFNVPVHLPDGVEVTSLSVDYYDGSATEDLAVQFVSSTTGLPHLRVLLAQFNSSGSAGYDSKSIPMNVPVTINNQQRTYSVTVGSLSGWTNDLMRVKSVIVTYRVNGPQ